MFTPELVARDGSEFHLVANHDIGTDTARSLSMAFMRARIAFGRANVPDPNARFIVHYDVRGQLVPEDVEAKLVEKLGDVCEIVVKRQ
jgi:hypothetical protein